MWLIVVSALGLFWIVECAIQGLISIPKYLGNMVKLLGPNRNAIIWPRPWFLDAAVSIGFVWVGAMLGGVTGSTIGLLASVFFSLWITIITWIKRFKAKNH